MEIAVTKTLSLNMETITNLNKLSNDTELNMSELVRTFINYFFENRDKLEELLKGGGE